MGRKINKIRDRTWELIQYLNYQKKPKTFFATISLLIITFVVIYKLFMPNNISNYSYDISASVTKNINFEINPLKKEILCENFFNKSIEILGFDKFVSNNNQFSLKEGVGFADLICNDKIPLEFGLKLIFIPHNQKVINLGVSEYTETKLSIFRLILGDGDDRKIVIKDSSDNNLLIRRHSDQKVKYNDSANLKNAISQDEPVTLTVRQYKVDESKVQLSIVLTYKPKGATNSSSPAVDSFDVIIDNKYLLPDLDYMLGIGLFKGNDEKTAVEFVHVKVEDQTL